MIKVSLIALMRYNAHMHRTFTFDLDVWQWPSISGELWSWPPTHKLKLKGQSVQKIGQTDGRYRLLYLPANVVGNKGYPIVNE